MADGILSVLRNTAVLAGDSDEEIMKEVVRVWECYTIVSGTT